MRFWGWQVVLLLCVGCQSRDTLSLLEVNSGRIYGNYSVDFNAQNQRVTIFAQLRSGGSTGPSIDLGTSNPLLINGETIAPQRTPGVGTFYSLQWTETAPLPVYTFQWRLPEGRRIENSVSVPTPLSVLRPSAGIEHSALDDLRVEFSGEAVRTGDMVNAHLETETTPKPGEERSWVRSIRDGTSLFFPRDTLRRFARGPAVLYLVRERRGLPAQGHEEAGGLLRSTYRCPDVHLEIR